MIQKNSFWVYFLLFIIAESLSWLAFNWLYLNILLAVALFILAFILAYRRPEYALYLSAAELFWGAAGHSFGLGIVSSRLLIFLAIALAFLSRNIWRLRQLKIYRDRAVLYLLIFLLIALGLAWFLALYNRYPLVNVFFDANAYFYLLYFPIWYEWYRREYLANILTILGAAALVLAVKTLLVFNIYTQAYKSFSSYSFYQWIRDTRTAEVTPLPNDFWRVFMPAQLYIIAAGLVVWLRQFTSTFRFKEILYLGLLGAALYISLSRSFWLGIIFSGLVVCVSIFVRRHQPWLVCLRLVLVLIISFIFVELAYNLPRWHSPHIWVANRTQGDEAAVSSREQLWPVMLTGIGQSPLIGHGFGKELSYRSSDPRIKTADNPEGWLTTYSFEWGWLDFWLKGGVLLPACFLGWILLIWKRAYERRQTYWLAVGLMSFSGALALIHFFSPYLNHPLGLGALMLSTIIISHE